MSRYLIVIDDFQCPLTMEVMSDPVITADGQSYEHHTAQCYARKRIDVIGMLGLKVPEIKHVVALTKPHTCVQPAFVDRCLL